MLYKVTGACVSVCVCVWVVVVRGVKEGRGGQGREGALGVQIKFVI